MKRTSYKSTVQVQSEALLSTLTIFKVGYLDQELVDSHYILSSKYKKGITLSINKKQSQMTI